MNTSLPPHIDPNKPVEWLLGVNIRMVETIVNRLHVGESDLRACRMVRQRVGRWSKISRPLRRGVIATALETHRKNRILYVEVMQRRNLTRKSQQAWKAYNATKPVVD